MHCHTPFLYPRQTLSINHTLFPLSPEAALRKIIPTINLSRIHLHFLLERDRKEWNYSYQAGNTHWVMHANTNIKLSHVTEVEKTEVFFLGGGGLLFLNIQVFIIFTLNILVASFAHFW